MLGAVMSGVSGVEIPKGDPGALREAGHTWTAAANMLAGQAQRVDAQGSVLSTASKADSAQASGGGWWGSASAAYRSYASNVASSLSSSSDAFETAAGAVKTFAHDLHHEQNNAKRARDEALDVLADKSAAQQAHDDAAGRLTTANGAIDAANTRASIASLGGPLTQSGVDSARHDRDMAQAAAATAAHDMRVAQRKIEAAQRRLDRAREHGRDANEAAERAARTCAARLHDASGALVELVVAPSAPVPITNVAPPSGPGTNNPFGMPFHSLTPGEAVQQIQKEMADKAERDRKAREGNAVDRFAGEFEGLTGFRPPFGIGNPNTEGYKRGKKFGNIASYFPSPSSLWKQGAKQVIKKGAKHEAGDIAEKKAKKELADAGRRVNPKFWNKSTEFGGHKVLQRDDLIDPGLVDAKGRSNVARMKKGLAPLGPDGEPINLHHLTQMDAGSLAEVTSTMHSKHHKIIHINPNTVPSGIDRPAFDRLRKQYWKHRSHDFAP